MFKGIIMANEQPASRSKEFWCQWAHINTTWTEVPKIVNSMEFPRAFVSYYTGKKTRPELSKLNPIVVYALASLIEIPYTKPTGSHCMSAENKRLSVSIIGKNEYAAEYRFAPGHKNGEKAIVVNYSTNGVLKASFLSEDANSTEIVQDCFDLGVAVCYCGIVLAYISSNRNNLKTDGFMQKIPEALPPYFADDIPHIISDLMADGANIEQGIARRVDKENTHLLNGLMCKLIEDDVFPYSGVYTSDGNKFVLAELTKNDIKRIADSGVVMYGSPYFTRKATNDSFDEGSEENNEESAFTAKKLKEKYASFAGRIERTDEEKEFIPVFDDNYPVPPEVFDICETYVKTREVRCPIVNFSWRGTTAYGKSTGVELIAYALNMPLLRKTCFSKMEAGDFLDEIIPSDEENDKSGPKFKRVESTYVTALKRGWICEVQEWSRIKDPGVLVSLNEYNRAGAIIPLSNGTYVRRHKDAMVIFTDNIGYVSCHRTDPSVLRRMGEEYISTDLTKEQVYARIKYNVGNDIKKFDKMYLVWRNIQNFCKTEGIEDGEISVQELENWALLYKVKGPESFESTCKTCVVNKASRSLDDINAIWDNVQLWLTLTEKELERKLC